MKDNDRALLSVAQQHHWLVTLEDVRRSGTTSRQWRRRIDAGWWVPVFPTVWRHSATPETWALKVRAGAAWLGEDAAVAGRTAARWWGLDGFEDVESVEFLVPRQRRSIRGITLHTTLDWDRRDLLRHDDVLLTSVTRTIIDLAAHGVPLRRLEAAVDSGVRDRRTSLPTLRQRIAELDQPGRRGVRRLKEVLLDGGGESDLERRFLHLMRRSGLPRPRPQRVLRREADLPMRIDFCFEAASLVAEVSGRLGHTSDRARQRETRRRNAISEQEMRYREFTTIDVIEDPAYVVRVIRTALGA